MSIFEGYEAFVIQISIFHYGSKHRVIVLVCSVSLNRVFTLSIPTPFYRAIILVLKFEYVHFTLVDCLKWLDQWQLFHSKMVGPVATIPLYNSNNISDSIQGPTINYIVSFYNILRFCNWFLWTDTMLTTLTLFNFHFLKNNDIN